MTQLVHQGHRFISPLCFNGLAPILGLFPPSTHETPTTEERILVSEFSAKLLLGHLIGPEQLSDFTLIKAA